MPLVTKAVMVRRPALPESVYPNPTCLITLEVPREPVSADFDTPGIVEARIHNNIRRSLTRNLFLRMPLSLFSSLLLFLHIRNSESENFAELGRARRAYSETPEILKS